MPKEHKKRSYSLGDDGQVHGISLTAHLGPLESMLHFERKAIPLLVGFALLKTSLDLRCRYLLRGLVHDMIKSRPLAEGDFHPVVHTPRQENPGVKVVGAGD